MVAQNLYVKTNKKLVGGGGRSFCIYFILFKIWGWGGGGGGSGAVRRSGTGKVGRWCGFFFFYIIRKIPLTLEKKLTT